MNVLLNLNKQKERIQRNRFIEKSLDSIWEDLDFSLDNYTNISNMFLNCSNLTDTEDIFNNFSVIASAELIDRLTKGQ